MAEEGRVPVRMFESDGHLTIAVPMPGLEPEDISVAVERNRVVLHGDERGPRRRDLILGEWSVGPYARELALPVPVRAELANATYGNGVLVLSLPKASGNEPRTSASFRLQAIAPGRGERVGSQGREANPARTEEHARRKHSARAHEA